MHLVSLFGLLPFHVGDGRASHLLRSRQLTKFSLVKVGHLCSISTSCLQQRIVPLTLNVMLSRAIVTRVWEIVAEWHFRPDPLLRRPLLPVCYLMPLPADVSHHSYSLQPPSTLTLEAPFRCLLLLPPPHITTSTMSDSRSDTPWFTTHGGSPYHPLRFDPVCDSYVTDVGDIIPAIKKVNGTRC